MNKDWWDPELLSNVYEEWKRFYNGHWQRTMPTKEGMYPIATRDGLWSDFVVVINHPTIGTFTPGREIKKGFETMPGSSWMGWFWSEPIPCNMGLPPPPSDKSEEDDES